jgi:hypothetical protein
MGIAPSADGRNIDCLPDGTLDLQTAIARQ